MRCELCSGEVSRCRCGRCGAQYYVNRGVHLLAPGWVIREIKRLRAIVDKLPKTKDGVPMAPGMELFVRYGGRITSGFARGFFQHRFSGKPPLWKVRFAWGDVDVAKQCYSTREAAEKGGSDE